jgi:hypothetical protein
MTSDRLLPGEASSPGTRPTPGVPSSPEYPRPTGEPVARVDWFRRAPNGGTVNAALPATSEPPHDPEAATTEP